MGICLRSAGLPCSMLRPDRIDLDEVLAEVAETGKGLRGEFLVSPLDPLHTPELLALAAWHGFLPMGIGPKGGHVLLKLHRHRCLLEPGKVHIGRKARKLAEEFRLSIDEAFGEVAQAIQEHTFTHRPGDNWLSRDLVQMYAAVGQLPERSRKGVAFHSVELWHRESSTLAAGEIGYTVGGVYSSCTGFALKQEFPGAGNVQMAALGRWLLQCGFKTWDLGMELDYKIDLGGELKPRKVWVAMVREHRHIRVSLSSPAPAMSLRRLFALTAANAKEHQNGTKPPTCGKRRQSAGIKGHPKIVSLIDTAGLDDSLLLLQVTQEAVKLAQSESPTSRPVLLGYLWMSSLIQDTLEAITKLVEGRWPRPVQEIVALLRQASQSGRHFGTAGPAVLHMVAICLGALNDGGGGFVKISDCPEGVGVVVRAAEMAMIAAFEVASKEAKPLIESMLQSFGSSGELTRARVYRELSRARPAGVGAAVGRDTLLWSVLAHNLAPSNLGPCRLPLAVACERLGLIAVSCALDHSAAMQIVQIHILEHLGDYLEWELQVEARCCSNTSRCTRQRESHITQWLLVEHAVRRLLSHAICEDIAAAAVAILHSRLEGGFQAGVKDGAETLASAVKTILHNIWQAKQQESRCFPVYQIQLPAKGHPRRVARHQVREQAGPPKAPTASPSAKRGPAEAWASVAGKRRGERLASRGSSAAPISGTEVRGALEATQ